MPSSKQKSIPDDGEAAKAPQRAKQLELLDFPNEFTRNRENFSDPFHIWRSAVVEEAIWGKQPNPEISN